MSFEQELTQEEKPATLKKGKLEIKTGFFGLAWFLHFVTPVIEINGQRVKKPWGTSYFELEPGNYTVKIYFSYFVMSQCGANQVSVKLDEGQSKMISYKMPPWMLAKGKMTVYN